MDPVRLRIYDNLFSAVAEEMGAALGRLGFSPNITERRDYSTAVFAADGSMIAQAAHIPVHLGSMPLSVASAIARLDLRAGDVAILNDPYEGGTHLPDITMVAPVWMSARARAATFFVANRAHHADVGGITGGSMALSREIFHEGLRIPPIKYAIADERADDVHRLLLANMRDPDQREGDLAAQLGALRVGVDRLRELVARNGLREVVAYAGHLQNYAERLMRSVIADIPDGVHRGEDHLDRKDEGERPRLRVAVAVRGDEADIDFAGTSGTLSDNRNANPAIALSAVFYVFRCLGGEEMPSNAGCVRPLRLSIPKSSLLDPAPPAAVAAGNVETSQRIVDVLLSALAKAMPSRIPAASQGTMNNLTIAGIDPRTGRSFTYYETIAGGTGASAKRAGIAAIHSHMTNTLNTPVETLETLYPLRVTRLSIRAGSGGGGRRRGGDGLTREIELLAPAEVAFIGERQDEGPAGAHGGKPGKAGRLWIVVDGRRRRVSGTFHGHLPAGARIVVETPGGGGWG